MTRSRLLPATVVATLALLAAPPPANADLVYLALGDSSTFGETDRTHNPSNGDRGYVKPFADYLTGRNGGVRPTVVNLAIDGETTSSYFSGRVSDRVSPDGIFHNTNYNAYAPNYPSQHDRFRAAVAAQLAAGNTIGTVTVQLGANNLDAVAGSPGFLSLPPAEQQARVLQALAAFQADYINVLGDLRAVLPRADLYTIGYHNPYPGDPTSPLNPLAAQAVQGLNQTIASVGPVFGGKYVDFYTPVLGRERELTLISTGDPVNGVHLKPQGYQVESRQLIGVASVPAPGGLPLLVIGLAAVAGWRRVRGRGVAV